MSSSFNVGVSQFRGTLFRGPYNKDYSILGSILGSPDFGKLPCGSYSPSIQCLGFQCGVIIFYLVVVFCKRNRLGSTGDFRSKAKGQGSGITGQRAGHSVLQFGFKASS